MIRTCRYCGIEIEPEDNRWVDVREGGVYDLCTARPYDQQPSGHRPLPE